MKFTQKEKKRVTEYFHIGIFLKGALSLVEIIAGILALFVPLSYITTLVVQLTQGELIEDPNDFIANHLILFAHQFSLANGTFIAVYLLSRGAIKLGLIIALLKNKLWAYPSSLVVLGFFVLYQLYQILLTFSALIIGVTIFDLVVMWLIWREYEIVRQS